MTDYPNANARWRRGQIGDKWRSLVSIFITGVLLLALFNGFARSLSLSDYFGRSTREGSRALVAVTNTTPGSILIFQPDEKKLVLATFDPRVYFATGDFDLPIKQLGEIFDLSDGDRMRYELSQVTKIPVGYFIFFEDRTYLSREGFSEFFKNLAAVTTPLRILTGKGLVGVKETNLTRSDLLILWWQAKSLGVNDLVFTNLSPHTSEIVLEDGQKVAGLEGFAVARSLAAYIEDRKILEEGKKVSVVNASGTAGSGQLASDLVSVAGIKIVSVAAGQSSAAVSAVVVGDGRSYTARYLAKILECDIKTRQDMAEEEIEVVIGQDFARKHLL